MRRMLLLVLAPVILAGTAVLVSPQQALAAGGVVETGITTYVVNTAKSEIDVTVRLTITNNMPFKETPVPCGDMTCIQETEYIVNAVYVWVPIQAVTITARNEIPAGAGSRNSRVSVSTFKTDADSRELKLRFIGATWGTPAHLTVTYAIPAGPRAAGGYRALKAYAQMCGFASGIDAGSISVVVPSGFDVSFSSGTKLAKSSDANGLQTFASGTVSAPSNLWMCLQATNPAGLIITTLTAGNQSFRLEAWPEDDSWGGSIGGDLQVDLERLQNLTGLDMPGGTIVVKEAGDFELGEYAGVYDSSTRTMTIAENTDQATVAHELSHIWFNPALLTDTWMDEGLAGYSEKAAGTGHYKPCVEPGSYPGTGSPDLTTWKYLANDATTTDQKVVVWQYAASCYLISQVADAIGPANFKAVLAAASKGEIAYLGAPPAEATPYGGPPISPENLLDLIDERGMLRSESPVQDQLKSLFVNDGIFDSAQLSTRSQARTAYAQLGSASGIWRLPLAVRGPMASWDFTNARTAINTATQIVTLRDQSTKLLPGFSPDGTPFQTMFESARTQSELESALALARDEVAAAAKVQQARQLNDGSRSILQTLGLLGVDLTKPLAQADRAMKSAKPADATTNAQKVIDSVNGSSNQGLMRLSWMLGLLVVAMLLLTLLIMLFKRRRHAFEALPSAAGSLDDEVVPVAAADAVSGPDATERIEKPHDPTEPADLS
jgi:hypothetical protein